MNYSEYFADPHRHLLSVRRAIEADYNVVEIDVRCTADGEFVLLHDITLERMTGVDWKPEELTLGELISLPLRNRDGGPNNPSTEEKLPSLRDVFELTRDKIYIHLDIKHRHVIPEVLAYARKMGVDKQVDFWADLKTGDDLAWIKANITLHEVPFIARPHLEHDDWQQQVRFIRELKPLICEASFRDISQVDEIKQHFHEAGINLWVNTLDSVASSGFTDSAALGNPEAVWSRLLRACFSAIQTDEMAALRSFLDTRK
ncbi:glycerophosphodiester phosphodiesterase 1 [Fusarium coicis]|nr:glycerophosphodiester phosphodiesterase 1 [Fusarium coicis]